MNEIYNYAKAASNLYGAIKINDLIEIISHYENENVTKEDVLKELINDSDRIIVKDEIISLGDYSLEYDMKEILELFIEQNSYSKYLPTKDEFLKYVDESYTNPIKPFNALYEYALKEGIKHENNDFVYDQIIELKHICALGYGFDMMVDHLKDNLFRFEKEEDFEVVMPYLLDIFNNTRMYFYNGHTANEVRDLLQK